MRETYRKLMRLLDARERRRFHLLALLVIAMGFFNMVGIASILPFLAVLADPGVVETQPQLAALYDALGMRDVPSFLVVLGIGVFAAYVTGIAVKTVTTYAMIRFTTMRGHSLSTRLLRGYLGQSYVWFLDRHSSDLTKTVLGEVQQVIAGVVSPMLNLMASIVLAAFLVGLLVMVDPVVAGAAGTVLGGAYAILYLVVRRRLKRLGEVVLAANKVRFRTTQEAMSGIKEIKTLGLESAYLGRFGDASLRLSRAVAQTGLLGELPRHLLEALVFGGALAMVVGLTARGDDLAEVLPIIGVYALAGSRLLPAAQNIYKTLGQLRSSGAVLDEVHRELQAVEATPAPPPPPPPLRLERMAALRGVVYAYPRSERPILNGLDMEIRANTTVGVVGGTGAGKTTAIDVLMGLLEPRSGALEIDGAAVTGEGLRAWRRSIGYVPQQIFLVDDTISANIAFGVPAHEIDHAAVERAARMAELHDFIVNELPEGYATAARDRGLRLSGGQRQRVGIARALYRDPDMLVLDEATAALDNLTERAVMDAVANLGGKKTIVMIAHRLTTVMGCDEIFVLEAGRVAARGSYRELIETSPVFRRMVEATDPGSARAAE